jgi:hypothetical protein
MKLARPPSRKRDDLASAGAAEVPQGSASDETRGARNHNLLACHSHVLRCIFAGP